MAPNGLHGLPDPSGKPVGLPGPTATAHRELPLAAHASPCLMDHLFSPTLPFYSGDFTIIVVVMLWQPIELGATVLMPLLMESLLTLGMLDRRHCLPSVVPLAPASPPSIPASPPSASAAARLAREDEDTLP
ncbi:hypothetical protein ACLOJK_018301, partial [Asimina triloba]